MVAYKTDPEVKALDESADRVRQDIRLDGVKLLLQTWIDRAKVAKEEWAILSIDEDRTDFNGEALQAFKTAGGVVAMTECVHQALDMGLSDKAPMYYEAGDLSHELENIFNEIRYVCASCKVAPVVALDCCPSLKSTYETNRTTPPFFFLSPPLLNRTRKTQAAMLKKSMADVLSARNRRNSMDSNVLAAGWVRIFDWREREWFVRV